MNNIRQTSSSMESPDSTPREEEEGANTLQNEEDEYFNYTPIDALRGDLGPIDTETPVLEGEPASGKVSSTSSNNVQGILKNKRQLFSEFHAQSTFGATKDGKSGGSKENHSFYSKVPPPDSKNQIVPSNLFDDVYDVEDYPVRANPNL
jgi:hypothetical protein